MKTLLFSLLTTTIALSTLPAMAAPQSIVINGNAAAQCSVSGATTATITGGGAAGLADSNGMLDGSAQSRIVTALNATNTFAWCTGGSTIVLTRTPLVKTGSTGALDSSGFARAIGYDVGISIANASRTDNAVGPNGDQEGTSDGPSGPTFNPFGPLGSGNRVTFVNDGYAPAQSFNATPRTLDLTSGASYAGGSTTLQSQVLATPTRLAAGDYSATVTLTITPAGLVAGGPGSGPPQ